MSKDLDKATRKLNKKNFQYQYDLILGRVAVDFLQEAYQNFAYINGCDGNCVKCKHRWRCKIYRRLIKVDKKIDRIARRYEKHTALVEQYETQFIKNNTSPNGKLR